MRFISKDERINVQNVIIVLYQLDDKEFEIFLESPLYPKIMELAVKTRWEAVTILMEEVMGYPLTDK